MIRLFNPLVILLTLILIPCVATANTNQRLDDGEILVTTDDVAGSDTPRVNVYGVIDAPPHKVWEIVSKCDDYVGIMPRIEEAKEVERDGDTVVCDVTVGLPFPLSDLRALSRATHSEGPPEWKREWELVEGDYHTNDGSWRLRAFRGDESRTIAIYSVHADPTTRIPDRIQRRAQQRSMPGVIEALREATR